MQKIRLGISSCLLGNPVRYDGGHKLDRFLRDTLGKYVDYVPVCPEVECGLPVPRESMHLEGDFQTPRLLTSRTRVDLTERMLTWSTKRIKELDTENLCGFVFKSNSPSSGMERTKVYDAHGIPRKVGTGIFARLFMSHYPLLPVEDEGRLHDMAIRENFIERIFIYSRWRDLAERGISISSLLEFHTRHKLLVLAHSTKHYSLMGKLLAEANAFPPAQLYARYVDMLMEALKLKATIKKNTNVLQHLAGYFKKQLSTDEKQELQDLINQYHAGFLPLIVPVTMVNHYARKYQQAYLRSQFYLNPHPVELQLRNHV
jgi:uncharacterized protein YbgA (DUF1722 family)/uncharacterized protein YbbK (DUF523 family)